VLPEVGKRPESSISGSFRRNRDLIQTELHLLRDEVRSFPNLQIDKSTDQQIVRDGTDEAGKRVSSGIYFYKLKSEGFDSAVSKMILLR